MELLKDTYEKIINEKKMKIREHQKQINNLKKGNKQLDEQIEAINVDVCEFMLEKDQELEKLEKYIIKNR